MDILFIPTSNLLINTFLRSIVVIAISILGFKTTWYSAYWAAIIHDAISLFIIRKWWK